MDQRTARIVNDGAVSGHPRRTDGRSWFLYICCIGRVCGVCGGGHDTVVYHMAFFGRASGRVGSGSPVSRFGHPGETGSVSPRGDAKKPDSVPR